MSSTVDRVEQGKQLVVELVAELASGAGVILNEVAWRQRPEDREGWAWTLVLRCVGRSREVRLSVEDLEDLPGEKSVREQVASLLAGELEGLRDQAGRFGLGRG